MMHKECVKNKNKILPNHKWEKIIKIKVEISEVQMEQKQNN